MNRSKSVDSKAARCRGPALMLLLLSSQRCRTCVNSFEWSSASGSIGRPEINHKAIAGLWKLTTMKQPPPHSQLRPMKEFTVYPKKGRLSSDTNAQEDDRIPDFLLMLKEDGSFQQYTSSPTPDSDESDAYSESTGDLASSWASFQKNREKQRRQPPTQPIPLFRVFIKGTWAYREGNLILAADREASSASVSSESKYQALADGYTSSASSSTLQTQSMSTSTYTSDVASTKTNDANDSTDKQDTLLEGRVVANYQHQLVDNPVVSAGIPSSTLPLSSLSTSNATATDILSSTSSKGAALDAYLSVPKGSISIGKFFYPRSHPSFFDQPMFQPVSKGSFVLRQVLGSLNTEQDNDKKVVEKFQRSDFYNKTFFLTAHPIGYRPSNPPSGDLRWSIKYNSFVQDPPSRKASTVAQDAAMQLMNATGIRVLQLAFHCNNTFSTTAGLGNSAILRGKFDVIGTDRDHLWMQVIRFGFGRSVSGSVYSEGPMLSHEDAKAYWGVIRRQIDNKSDVNNNTNIEDAIDTRSCCSHERKKNSLSLSEVQAPLMEVEGSVLDGWGLEPMPVAKFIMRETTTVSADCNIDDEDMEEDDDPDDEDEGLRATRSFLQIGLDDDGVDWSSKNDNSFQ